MDFVFSNGTALEPYLKVSAIHEFLTGSRTTVDEIGFNPTLSGTLVDAGAGLAVRLNQSVYLYGEYDYANGDKIRQPWAVNAGLRWQWGGKPEEATMVEQPLAKQLAGKEEAKVVKQPPAKTTEPWQIFGRGTRLVSQRHRDHRISRCELRHLCRRRANPQTYQRNLLVRRRS